MRSGVRCCVLFTLLGIGCSRPRVAPSDDSLPQPNRDGCPRFSEITINARFPSSDRLVEYGAKYCDPLEELFRKNGLAYYTGDVAGVEDDLEFFACGYRTSDQDEVIQVMRGALLELGAPAGTVIEEACEGIGAVHEL